MTKAITARFQEEKDKRGAAPINLIEIDLPGPLGRIRLADRNLSLPEDYDVWAAATSGQLGWAGPNLNQVEYLGLIERWPEEIEPRVSPELETADIGDLHLTLLNTGRDGKEVPFSYYFLTTSPEGAEVRIYQLFLPLPLSQRDLVFRGTLAEPLRYDQESCSFDVVTGPAKKLLGKKIAATEFPAAAPEVIGRVKPLIYGELKDFPALAVGIGAFDLLREDFIVGQDNLLKLSDVSRFPSSGAVKLGPETISYTGKDTANNNLTGVTSALYSHRKGDLVWEVRATYDFLVAGHPVAAINDIRVNGLLVPAMDYSLDLSAATIKFSNQPMGLLLSQHEHEPASSTTSLTLLRQNPVGGLTAWRDGNEATGATNTSSDMSFSTNVYGAMAEQIEWWVKWDGNGQLRVKLNNATTILDLAYTGVNGWYRATGGAGWGDYLNVNVFSGGTVYEVYREVRYIPSITTTDKDFQIPGLDFWRGAVVTCTVQGKKDDASGTITGTPYALIERPDHVIKSLLINELGYYDNDLDEASFQKAGNEYAALGYAFAGALIEQEEARRLLARLALCARSWFFWDPAARARLIFRSLSGPPSRSLNKGDIFLGSLKLMHTPVSEIFNRINIHYDRDWRMPASLGPIGETSEPARLPEVGFSAMVTGTDAASLARFGERERSYLFDFVRLSAMAEDLKDFYLSLHSQPRLLASLETFLPNYDLERGDFIDLTYSDLALINHPLEIINSPRILGSAKARRMDRVRIMAEGKKLSHAEMWGQGDYARVPFGP